MASLVSSHRRHVQLQQHHRHHHSPVVIIHTITMPMDVIMINEILIHLLQQSGNVRMVGKDKYNHRALLFSVPLHETTMILRKRPPKIHPLRRRRHFSSVLELSDLDP